MKKPANRGAISIRTKLIQMQLVLAFVLLLVCTAGFFLKDLFYFKKSVERNMESTSRILSNSLIPALAFSDAEQATKVLLSLQRESGISSALVTDLHGNTFASYNTLQPEALAEIEKLNMKKGSLLYGDHLIFFDRLEQNNEVIGTIYLDASLAIFLAEYKYYIWIALGVFVASFLMALGLAHWSHRALSQPMLELTRTARKISRSGDSSLRVESHQIGQDIEEFNILSTEFNQMLDQLQLKEQRIHDEKEVAEKANASKSLFLANISHELRTPMHGILSFARFGQQKYETSTKEKLKSYFDEIYSSGERLMNLLNDLLDLSKLEAGKTTYNMAEAHLAEAIQAVSTELSAFASERQLIIEVQANSAPAPTVFDSEKIMQVLRNIVSNAIKFSNPGTAIQIQLQENASTSICRIVNFGIGIPANELESIFDKFIQSSKTKTGAGGTGLGLAICKEIVRQHGGRIWAESHQNGETHFIFELPKTQIIAEKGHVA